MPEWSIYIAAAAMAAFLVWIFWSERQRTKREVVPLAEAMPITDLRSELQKIADRGGFVEFDEHQWPLPEAAVFRASKEGLIWHGPRTDAPSDTKESLWLTERGWIFIGRNPPKGYPLKQADGLVVARPIRENQLLGSMWFAIPLVALMVTAISVCAPFFMLHALIREKRRS